MEGDCTHNPEDEGERIRESGQEPIVQVSVRDLPLIF